MSILAIDQGTSGTKAIVVDDAGDVLALTVTAVHPTYLAGGCVEQDPAELLTLVLSAGKQAVARAGVPIDAVALANQEMVSVGPDYRRTTVDRHRLAGQPFAGGVRSPGVVARADSSAHGPCP